MSKRALSALLVALITAACAESTSVVGAPAARPDAARPGDVTAPDLDAPRFDVPPRDVADVADAADAPAMCEGDRGCARGQRCLQGRCAEDVCLASENPCGGDRCEMRCVPVRDLCDGVACTDTETCFSGRCVAGCFPAPCEGVRCPAGQFCDDGTGRCARVTPCPAVCDAGFTCHVRCLPRSPCDGVTCASTEVCADGRCVVNPCAGVNCTAGALCVDGRCTPTCGCDPRCDRSPRDRCVTGRCVCNSLCQADTPCGTDDGCGGRCVGPCPNPFATCDPVLFTCACTNRCNPSSRCGDDDGCGGQCDLGCGVGERCDLALRRCICVTRCPPLEASGDTPCGMPIANGCPGAPSCGVGTGCPPRNRCNLGTRRCEPSTEEMPDGGGGGGGCAPPRLMCSEECVDPRTDNDHCGTCGNVCPAGTNCVGGVCTCPAPLSLCGARCVNLASDNAHCGACNTPCPARTDCQGGVCRCIPACTVNPLTVTCGVDIPNACPGGPPCGVGRVCAEGEVCDTAARRCVCVPRCPPGVRCGVSDGCGSQCAGVCDAGSTCTRDSVDSRRYYCSDASCASGCRCDEVCTLNRCVPVVCPSGDRPCPCQCCPAGQMCVGGAACVPIPP